MQEQLAALGLPADASFAKVKSTYRKLVMCWHPDRFPHGDPMRDYAEKRIKEINSAFAYVQANRYDLKGVVDWSEAELHVPEQTGLYRKRQITRCFTVVRRKKRSSAGEKLVRGTFEAPRVLQRWCTSRKRKLAHWWQEFTFYCS